MNAGFLLAHPTGNANVRAALLGLFEAQMLAQFHTTIAAFPGNFWDAISRNNWARDFRRRGYDARLRPMTVQHPFRELGRMFTCRTGLNALGDREGSYFSIDSIYQSLDRVAAGRLRANGGLFAGIYAYEDGALECLTAAKELKLKRVYELPIAYWDTVRRLLAQEAERLPRWKKTLGGGVGDSQAKLLRKSKELSLAELVICPSHFVARSIPETMRRGKQIAIVPFGSPPAAPNRGVDRDGGRSKLRVLFAGSMSQRKGLGDLFAAVRLLNRRDVELVVMGAPQAPMEFYRGEFADFIYEPGRPHDQVLELMRSCDVFCLPSLAEGRALVMQEAMSQGLPLIVTANTGGEDLIDEGRTGFLVPIRNAEKIAEKIAWFADHRAAIADMSRAAKDKAAELTWTKYGRTIAEAIRNLKPS
jgi:glycosyltransferase involved in cell wall biosynthesis